MDFWRDQNGTIAVDSLIMVLGFSAILEGSCHAGIDSLCWRSDVFAADGQAVDVVELSSVSPTSTPEFVTLFCSASVCMNMFSAALLPR